MKQRKRSERSAGAGAVVRKVTDTLRMLPEGQDGWSVRELAATLGEPKSTVHRLLQILQSEDLVRVDPVSHRYRIGIELYRLAVRITANMDIRRLARNLLEEMVSTHNETAVLGVYIPTANAMTFVEVVQSDHPVRYVPELGKEIPIHIGASGKSILAYLPDGQLEAALARHPDPAWLARELEEVRRTGYAVSLGERIEAAVGISAPFFDAAGNVNGCVMFTIPKHRCPAGAGDTLGPVVRAKAQSLTSLLGGQTWPHSAASVARHTGKNTDPLA